MGNPMGGAPGGNVDPILLKQAQALGINPEDLQRKTRANGLAQLAASLGQGQPLGAGLSQGLLAMQGAGDQVYGQEIQRAQAAKDIERKDAAQKAIEYAAKVANDPSSTTQDITRAYAQAALMSGQFGALSNTIDTLNRPAKVDTTLTEPELALKAAGGDPAKALQLLNDGKRRSSGTDALMAIASGNQALMAGLIGKANAQETGKKTAEEDANTFSGAVKAADRATQLSDDMSRLTNTLGKTGPEAGWVTGLKAGARGMPVVGPMLGGLVDTPELSQRLGAQNQQLDIISKYTDLFKPMSDTDTRFIVGHLPGQINTPEERQYALDGFKLLAQRERGIVDGLRQKYPNAKPAEITADLPALREQNAVAPILQMMYPEGPGKPRVMTIEQATERLRKMREQQMRNGYTPVQ